MVNLSVFGLLVVSKLIPNKVQPSSISNPLTSSHSLELQLPLHSTEHAHRSTLIAEPVSSIGGTPTSVTDNGSQKLTHSVDPSASEPPVHLAHPETPEHQDPPDRLAHLESPDLPEHQVWASLDPLVHKVSKVKPELTDPSDQLVQPDHKVNKELSVPVAALWVSPDRPDPPAHKASKVSKVTRVIKASKVIRVIKASKVTRVIKASKAFRVIKASKAFRVIKASKAFRVIKVFRVTRASKVKLVSWGQLDQPAHKELLVTSVHSAQLDPLVDHKDLPESQDHKAFKVK
jgi:hypothetical protein